MMMMTVMRLRVTMMLVVGIGVRRGPEKRRKVLGLTQHPGISLRTGRVRRTQVHILLPLSGWISLTIHQHLKSLLNEYFSFPHLVC